MNNSFASPLQQLRDIHLPPPVSNWLLAPGWYVLGFILILTLAFFTLRAFNKMRQMRAKKAALRYLQNLQQKFYEPGKAKLVVAELSTLLRRVALAKYPRQQVAGLNGHSWLIFLDHTGDTQQFSQGTGRLLTIAPYTRVLPKHSEQLFPLVKQWIERNG